MNRVRALIVDDSASMRAALTRILSGDPEIEVIGAAPEPHTAREMIKELNPDVLTLDVEMPGMDGLSFLERIMRLRPMPVVMCSSLTAAGAEVTIEALRLGAVDCIAKPAGGPVELALGAEQLRATVKGAARSQARRGQPAPAATRQPPAPAPGQPPFRDVVIAIGASTGGVEALFHVLGELPQDCPPVLVVQHMPAAFTASFAARLDRGCAVRVVEATDGAQLQRGTVYIAPGGSHHMVLDGGTRGRIKLVAADPVNGHRPSVDMLFDSVAKLGRSAVAAILTGMGSDGANGMLAMRQAGARTFGQSRDDCVVWGMPRAALLTGAVETETSLSSMAGAILAASRGKHQER
ncbi:MULTISPECIES: chemotaxis response regulator protein-glutamate methylesterase [unclassified Sphingomonas]|uniref:protein-glutamate methylesterase/protein-glutamine glutaminase n=1 Tax=unclassified Sphingomonas TaxID=196159 RepID=UPI002150D051|nr:MULTISPECIES: chemotaxis response regulator protein-glutamate methylesterase [unclassified Sphingomonas]MCR5869321.1 chemotaxis response regulator protein-glutamate methylesterase [Sphingomonas sp. J344]UUX98947.1 chemotaxis response regulator protein-glutamate methylesterase [Sphingomonas sp. J315]